MDTSDGFDNSFENTGDTAYPYTAGKHLGHFSTRKVAKNPGLVYGSVFFDCEKAPFGDC